MEVRLLSEMPHLFVQDGNRTIPMDLHFELLPAKTPQALQAHLARLYKPLSYTDRKLVSQEIMSSSYVQTYLYRVFGLTYEGLKNLLDMLSWMTDDY